MRTDALKRKLSVAAMAVGLISVLGTGCSGSQQEEEKLEATPAEEAAPAAPAEAEAEATETEEVEATGDEAAVAVPATNVTEVPTTPAVNSTVDKNRVVRYVNSGEVVVRGQPNDKSEAVGKLSKGDMILVIEGDGWGKISENMFIRLDSLSKKAVPRDRTPAVWGKPAH